MKNLFTCYCHFFWWWTSLLLSCHCLPLSFLAITPINEIKMVPQECNGVLRFSNLDRTSGGFSLVNLRKNILPKNIFSRTQYFAQLSPFSLLSLRPSIWIFTVAPFSSSSSFVLSSSLPTRLTFDIFQVPSLEIVSQQPTYFHYSPTTWITLPHSFHLSLFAFYFFKCLLFYFFLFFN